MAENTTVNKVVINNQPVIDITDTTATPSSVGSGQVFYKASGERAVGTMLPEIYIGSTTPSGYTMWIDPEVYVGTDTPTGYKVWIDPDGSYIDANEVKF